MTKLVVSLKEPSVQSPSGNTQLNSTHSILSLIKYIAHPREEKEKFNIWVAYLNLENLYGSPEQMQAIIDRALTFCDPMKVYQQLIMIYVKSEKIQVSTNCNVVNYNTFLSPKEIINMSLFDAPGC